MTENGVVIYSGSIDIDYGQFYIDVSLEDEGDEEQEYLDPDAAFLGQKNGICGAAQAGKLFFVAGIHGGVIRIIVEHHIAEPTIDDSFGEIVEVAFRRGGRPVSLCEWGQEETHSLELPEGDYRVRYCIDGMEKDYAEDDEYESPVPGQRHLVQIWRSDPKEDSIFKCTSDTAVYWHKEWGSME